MFPQVTNLGPSPVGDITVSSSLPFGLMLDQDFPMVIFIENINPQVTKKNKYNGFRPKIFS
jgi:hypothetical protein